MQTPEYSKPASLASPAFETTLLGGEPLQEGELIVIVSELWLRSAAGGRLCRDIVRGIVLMTLFRRSLDSPGVTCVRSARIFPERTAGAALMQARSVFGCGPATLGDGHT